MKHIYLALFLSSLLFTNAGAQTITITDGITMQGIPGVAVFSSDKSISGFTNVKGEIDAAPFLAADTIHIKYVGYTTRSIKTALLSSMNYRIDLEVNNISLDEVIISANKWEEDKIENPVRVEKISMKEVALQNPQTAADMLTTSGYVFVQKSQLGGGSPMLRGFATNRVLLVVDGVRMNNAIFRSGNIQNVIALDPLSMQSAEVLFGPGAVLYGSDAIGGVMDFHTLSTYYGDTLSRGYLSGRAVTRYSSANSEKTGHLDLNYGFKKMAFVTSLTFSDFDDLKAGSNGTGDFLRHTYQATVNGTDTIIKNSDPSEQAGTSYSQFNVMQKIAYKPVDVMEIDYAFHYSQSSNIPRYDRLYLDSNGDGILDNAEWYYGPQKWMMNRLGLTLSNPTLLFDRMKFIAAMQQFEESRNDRRFKNSSLRTQTENVDAYSFNMDLEKSLSDEADVFYGVEYVRNIVGSSAKRRNIESGETQAVTTRYPDGSIWEASGIYSNLRYRFSDAFTANAGIRYTYYNINATFDTTLFLLPFTEAENSNGSVNGSLGIVYSPVETFQLYLNGATGFRAPNIDDIGKIFESEPGSLVVPNVNLKPEYAWNAEIGVAKVFGKKLKVDLSVYYTLLDNALARRNFTFNGADSILYDGEMSKVQAIQNIARAYVYGFQAGVEMSFAYGITLRSRISFQEGEEQSEDSLKYYPKSHVPPLFGSTHLVYMRKKLSVDLYAEYNGGMAFEDLSLNDRNDAVSFAKDKQGLPYVPEWYTINIKCTYFINRHFAVDAGMENISDQLYRPLSSGISAPGRNFIAALKARF